MRDSGGREAETAEKGAAHSTHGNPDVAHASQTQFVATGPIPPVGEGYKSSQTASQLAFGPGEGAEKPGHAPGGPSSVATMHADDVARIEYIYETAQSAATGVLGGVLGSLVPGYRAARDQLGQVSPSRSMVSRSSMSPGFQPPA